MVPLLLSVWSVLRKREPAAQTPRLSCDFTFTQDNPAVNKFAPTPRVAGSERMLVWLAVSLSNVKCGTLVKGGPVGDAGAVAFLLAWVEAERRCCSELTFSQRERSRASRCRRRPAAADAGDAGGVEGVEGVAPGAARRRSHRLRQPTP